MDIVKVVNQLSLDVHPLQLFIKKIRDSASISFWDDVWLGGLVLEYQFPRIYNLENSKGITVKEKLSHESILNCLCRHSRGGAESVQWEGLNSLIEYVFFVFDS